MNDTSNKEKRRLIILFITYLLIAFVCFAIFGYLLATYRGTENANDTIVKISQIIVLVGIFFLVLAFGHILPVLSTLRKTKAGVPNADATGIFSEAAMHKALGKYIPDGETILAGIHAVAKESSVTCAFGECVLTDDALLADPEGPTIAVSKSKYSTYDLYIGITQHSLVVADCETYRYYYEFNKEPINSETDIQIVDEDILLKDIGKCFRLADIQSCSVKNGFAGSINCVITLKNGSYFKLLIPTSGGLGGGMPHHEEYRDAIIECLSKSGS